MHTYRRTSTKRPACWWLQWVTCRTAALTPNVSLSIFLLGDFCCTCRCGWCCRSLQPGRPSSSSRRFVWLLSIVSTEPSLLLLLMCSSWDKHCCYTTRAGSVCLVFQKIIVFFTSGANKGDKGCQWPSFMPEWWLLWTWPRILWAGCFCIQTSLRIFVNLSVACLFKLSPD